MKSIYATQLRHTLGLYQVTYSDGPESEQVGWQYIEGMLKDGSYDRVIVYSLDEDTLESKETIIYAEQYR